MNLNDVDLNNTQSVFDYVVEKLQQQNCKSLLKINNGVNKERCAYRGTNGTKCAAGHLIPDSEYKEEWEGQAVEGVEYFVKNIKNGTSFYLLSILQEIHDDHDVSSWYINFKSIGESFGLDLSNLERVYSTKQLEHQP